MTNQNDIARLYGSLIAGQQASALLDQAQSQAQDRFMGYSLASYAGMASHKNYKPTTLELMQHDVSEILKDWDK